jgi:enoyl-CoA hydratase/3-hydroxyacyl-CoA dehydrogenase
MLRKENFTNPVFIKPDRGLPGKIAIIGAGTIGPDIGYYLKSALPDLQLVLIDINVQALAKARERIHGYVQKGIARGKLAPQLAAKIQDRIITSTDYAAMADCDWVLEAATENLSLKQEIFSRVEAVIRPEALITSNTSSLPAARLFSHLDHPQRATVTHFFAPAFKNPAVEVIEWQQSDPAVIDYLRWLFYMTGKTPLVTADVVCFMLDRIFDNWCNEAALLLEHVSASEIDTVATEFVHAGPFFVLNMANGNPIIVETNTLQAAEEGAHYQPARIFDSVAQWQTIAMGKSVEVSAQNRTRIRDRLLGILFSQAVDILDRNIGDASDLDAGCCLALGFKQGPIELMRVMGEAEVSRILTEFKRHKPGMPMPQQPVTTWFDYYRYLLVSVVDGVIVITLRRPEAMNALHDTMTDEILAVIRSHEDDPEVQGFVITGYGTQAFCAGADIGKFPDMLGDRQQSIDYARACSRLLVHLDQCRKPVIAALNGLALGGGLELAMRCHAMVAVSRAWMQLPEITLGIVPGIGAMVVPYRKWPRGADTFHDMLLRSAKLKAEQAQAIGMINERVDDHADLLPAAISQVKSMAGKLQNDLDTAVDIPPMPATVDESETGQLLSREVMAIIARAVPAAAASPSLSEALEIGYAAFGDSACTAAAGEGITAFMQRRKPDFSKTG